MYESFALYANSNLKTLNDKLSQGWRVAQTYNIGKKTLLILEKYSPVSFGSATNGIVVDNETPSVSYTYGYSTTQSR